jgi:hypothetical protein
MVGLIINFNKFMFLKNIITGEIGIFSIHQGENWANLTQEEIDLFNLQATKKELIIARSEFLSSTDWYTSREIDEPNSYPEVVKDKRILARQEINNIENCNSLLELEQYSIDFN